MPLPPEPKELFNSPSEYLDKKLKQLVAPSPRKVLPKSIKDKRFSSQPRVRPEDRLNFIPQ